MRCDRFHNRSSGETISSSESPHYGVAYFMSALDLYPKVYVNFAVNSPRYQQDIGTRRGAMTSYGLDVLFSNKFPMLR